jgi:hypothetical protein
VEQGVTPAFISVGAAAALHCHLKESGGEQTLEKAAGVLKEISSLAASSPAALILAMYERIVKGASFSGIIAAAAEAGARQGIV